MKNPELSVVMSVYNGDSTLEKTIKSVLSQTYANFEFIIVDDGSSDSTAEILKKYKRKDSRIKIITNSTNIGLTKSLNKGIKLASGRFIARIDSGDICSKNRFSKQISFLKKNKEYAVVGSFINIINEKGQKIGEITYPCQDREIRRGIIRTNLFAHSTLMIKKNVLDEMGAYDKRFFYSQDYELILRIGSKYKLANLPEYLVDYLFDSSGITVSPKRRRKQDWFALKARYYGLTKYGYSKRYVFDLLAAFAEYLVPFKIKLLLVKKNVDIKGKRIKFII